MPVSSWSPNAGSNTGILSGLTLDGAVMTVPQLDNAFREMAAQIAAQLGKLNFKGADMASASTTNLANATGWYLDITGTTTITAFGTVDAGQMFILRFTSALTLTHNASSLVLPTGANIVTVAGDVAFMMSLGSGSWRCINYQSPAATFTTLAITQGAIISGTYTPTASASTNLAAITEGVTSYMRVGSVVTVSGLIVTDTLATGGTSFELSLPITSNFAATTDCAGCGTVGTLESMRIVASAANNTAVFSWTSVVTSVQTYSFTFTYLIV